MRRPWAAVGEERRDDGMGGGGRCARVLHLRVHEAEERGAHRRGLPQHDVLCDAGEAVCVAKGAGLQQHLRGFLEGGAHERGAAGLGDAVAGHGLQGAAVRHGVHEELDVVLVHVAAVEGEEALDLGLEYRGGGFHAEHLKDLVHVVADGAPPVDAAQR